MICHGFWVVTESEALPSSVLEEGLEGGSRSIVTSCDNDEVEGSK